MVISECVNVILKIDEQEEEVNMCQAWEEMALDVMREEIEVRMREMWEDRTRGVQEETKARMREIWEARAQEVRNEKEVNMCQAWEEMAQEVREETVQETAQRIMFKLYKKGRISLEEALEETGLLEEEFLISI